MRRRRPRRPTASRAVVAAAKHYIGTPYAWGGGDINGPSAGTYSSTGGGRVVGFDCSGLVLFAVYNATGVQLAHSAETQGKDSRGSVVPWDWDKMRAGDVVSFSEDGSGAAGSFGHVGIYLGNGQMIHAPRPGKSVEIVQLRGSRYYEPMAWSIRRYAKS
nr:C40 family peptidase [Actinopolymorpha pittospori]